MHDLYQCYNKTSLLKVCYNCARATLTIDIIIHFNPKDTFSYKVYISTSSVGEHRLRNIFPDLKDSSLIWFLDFLQKSQLPQTNLSKKNVKTIQ